MSIVAGLVSGAVVGWVNYQFLKKGVAKMIQSQKKLSALVLAIKFFPLLGVAALLILVAHVNPIAFMAGFAAILAGICWRSIYAS
jgi:hypothetical protein